MSKQNIPYHKQETCWTCGSASTRMILEVCGIKKSEKQVVKLLGTNKIRGTWARLYPQLFDKYKLNYIVMRNAKIEDMKKLMQEGYYILTSYYYPRDKVDHFVVVSGIDDNYIYFNDPFFGPEHKYKLTYFQKVWRTDPRYDNERCWFIGVKK